ncbi:hypothetical protein [Mucilaginibacter phyllosphaerae]
MKTLTLPPHPTFTHTQNNRYNQPIVTVAVVNKAKTSAAQKAKTWFNADAPENLTIKEAIIRAAFVVTMPMLSAIDWTYGTHTLIFIIPVIFYLEVTAFTLSCPIKALFSNYSHPTKYE